MTLNEAIEYYDSLAEECRRKASIERNDYMDLRDESAEYSQLSEWLAELAVLREKVNCSELPNSSDCICRQADLIDRAEAQTELQFAVKRYTVAKEAHGEGQVVWGENLISVTDAMNALRKVPSVQAQQMIPTQMPGTSNSSTKFKPGSKFLLEIGEKRIGLDEYSIVGTDLYVWGSLLEKLTPYEPSVQTEQKWIPCSEALPKDNEYVLLTIRRLNKAYNQLPFISIGYVSWNGMCWWCAHDGDCKSNDIDVMAWQPLPEPYRGDTE